MKKASTIALSGNSGVYAAIDCNFDYTDRELWAAYSVLCSGCLDATGEIPAGSVVVFQTSASLSWPACSTITR